MPGINGEPTTEQPRQPRDMTVELLVEAGAVMASSLDVDTTMQQVAQLTVPRLADLCAIDLRDDDGTIKEAAVAAADPSVGPDLEALRRRHPLDPDGEHPVARVIASGEPMLLAQMSDMLMRSFAQGSEHARFMIEHRYRSAVVAPLVARGRTLGALSVLRLGDCEPYGAEDLALACELARRAALAIDNARLYSEVRQVEQRLAAILVNLAEAITLVDARGRMVFANQAAADLLGASSPEQLMRARPGSIMERFLVLDEQGRELTLEGMPSRRLFRGERPEPLLVRNIVRATGEERWLIVRASAISDPESGRVLYAVNVFENITEVKRAQLAESFMAEASRLLASSMDYGETLQRIARLAVPQIADGCAVDVVSEAGEVQRVAVHHSDPAMVELAQRLDRGYRPSLDDAEGVAEVIRSGQARLYEEVDPGALAAYARDNEHLELLQRIGARSAIIAPLAAPPRALGAVTLICSDSRRRFSEADLGLAVRLGRRAGTAVERARLYTERNRIARVLGAALLPEALPDVPGVQIEALYRAAGELNDVGGDFYDVLPYGADRWLLLIGDVCGKGPRAAGVTALARHTLRTAAMLGQTPTGMLGTLHEALRRHPAGAELCTASIVTLQRSGRGRPARLTVALAGHPPPLIIDADGGVSQIGRPGTLLGMIDPLDLSEVATQLRLGQTLLLYTDGLPEAGRSDRRLGDEGLLELCAQAPDLDLASMLARVEHTALQHAEGKLRDDIALLAVRLQ
jgi:PAS domain S-box-containing protein